jgi:hypothetical protein
MAALPDPYLWLEDVTGEAALDWVRERNADTLGRLAQGERFESLRTEILDALDSSDRIPYVRRRGEHLYNFWQDAEHPRGLWRRTTLESYRAAAPEWDVLLDVDALGVAESVNWVWAGASLLRPTLDRALVELSRGGADAAVVREFDLTTRQFVEVGFPDMPPALTAGRVDAALVEEPFLSIAGNNGTAKVVDPAVYREIATDPIIVAGWFTTSSWMAQNPRTLAAFGRAIHRATDTINQDPDTARAAISKFTPTSAEQAKTVKLKAFSNDITPAQLQPWVDLSAKFGYIAKPFSPEVLVAG